METPSFVRRVRTESRRKFTSDEKIRSVLKGFRREVAVNERRLHGAEAKAQYLVEAAL